MVLGKEILKMENYQDLNIYQTDNKELHTFSRSGIELFCGHGTLTKVARSFDYRMLSIDIRKRKGICEPDIRMDIKKCAALFSDSKTTPDFLKYRPLFVWAGIPCDIWTYASGGFHLDSLFEPKTEKAEQHILLLKSTCNLITQLSPEYFFIENPRGKLRHYPWFLNWLTKHNGMTKELTLGSYGFETTKPTNVFTNLHSLSFKELLPYGRGNKSEGNFNALTTVQRQTYPSEFAQTIIEQLTDHVYKDRGIY